MNVTVTIEGTDGTFRISLADQMITEVTRTTTTKAIARFRGAA